jgi:hypothetical protein
MEEVRTPAARFDVRGKLTCAQDVDIDVNCLFEDASRWVAVGSAPAA